MNERHAAWQEALQQVLGQLRSAKEEHQRLQQLLEYREAELAAARVQHTKNPQGLVSEEDAATLSAAQSPRSMSWKEAAAAVQARHDEWYDELGAMATQLRAAAGVTPMPAQGSETPLPDRTYATLDDIKSHLLHLHSQLKATEAPAAVGDAEWTSSQQQWVAELDAVKRTLQQLQAQG